MLRATGSYERESLDDLTECPICKEPFTDPRVLPCLHSFCLKCLLSYGQHQPSSSFVPCPLCRNEFTVPPGGLSGIQKNFLMEKFLEMKRQRWVAVGPEEASEIQEGVADAGSVRSEVAVQQRPGLTSQLGQLLTRIRTSLPPRVVAFVTSSWSYLGGALDHLLAAITATGILSIAPHVSRVIQTSDRVGAMTTLGDELFVVCYNSDQHIDVYDAATLALQRRIKCRGLGLSPMGLAACPQHKVLYISDSTNDLVHRVSLPESYSVMWRVSGRPAGLSVNRAHNVIVVSMEHRKIQEFTTFGTLLRKLALETSYSFHAVQLTNGQFLVTFVGVLHRICLLDVDGVEVCSYGGTPGSKDGQLHYPAGLAVDGKGNVLVADRFNHRLLVLTRWLRAHHELAVSVDGDGLRGPCSLWYDEQRRRLYVGECVGRRVIVIDNLNDFTTAEV